MAVPEAPGSGAGPGPELPVRLGRDFSRLWAAETVSMVGSAVTTVAVPALAVLRLGAGPTEVGLIVAASRAPYPVVGLVAGVVADRLPRRAVMVACDLARVLILGSIPVADATGRTSIGLLLGVALLSGTFGVFFDIANLAYVPALVGRRGLVRAYSWLEVTNATSVLVGPGLGGLLVQALGAARAVAADSVSFAVSAVCLLSIRRPARATAVTGGPGAVARPSPATELREGVSFVLRQPVLRSLLLAQGILVLGAHAIETTASHVRRALQVQRLLAQRSRRGRKIPDLLVAAAAEQLDVAVLHYDADFDAIAAVTGQRCQWVVPAGSVP